jgi:hypothetical protein
MSAGLAPTNPVCEECSKNHKFGEQEEKVCDGCVETIAAEREELEKLKLEAALGPTVPCTFWSILSANSSCGEGQQRT